MRYQWHLHSSKNYTNKIRRDFNNFRPFFIALIRICCSLLISILYFTMQWMLNFVQSIHAPALATRTSNEHEQLPPFRVHGLEGEFHKFWLKANDAEKSTRRALYRCYEYVKIATTPTSTAKNAVILKGLLHSADTIVFISTMFSSEFCSFILATTTIVVVVVA